MAPPMLVQVDQAVVDSGLELLLVVCLGTCLVLKIVQATKAGTPDPTTQCGEQDLACLEVLPVVVEHMDHPPVLGQEPHPVSIYLFTFGITCG